MTALSPDQCRQVLTSSQRLVLDSFEYNWDVLTIKDIRKETKEKISVKTIRRALAKLCDMGVVVRLKAEKQGRGYTHQYRLASGKDEGKGKEQKEEVKDKDDPLSELNDLLTKYKREAKEIEE
ncbi:hypothetical protein KAX06_03545 [candidate division WOR-3 bacterium]|nr:hypothetical protein [candidate division WOR-3 bacterium]